MHKVLDRLLAVRTDEQQRLSVAACCRLAAQGWPSPPLVSSPSTLSASIGRR